MSSNTLAAITPFVSQMDTALRTFGFDLKQWASTLDLATVGIVMLLAGLGVLLFNLVGYKLAAFSGNAADYHPYGRSLLTGAAEAWQNRNDLGLDTYFTGVRGRSMDINNVSNIIDAISNAVLEWETPILSTAASSTHNTIAQHPKFPNAVVADPQREQSVDWGWN